ncbi:MAG: SLBB domain-containing protein [Bacteroidota bacterium]|nr:SLBB domain-containing protein [Bacteroidota bacterium]MDE2644379.1 SLBB domain-containing protein [Bacteroidota bacterium]MXW13944.1 hypothetical protein [Rhodothermaceae bacterium]MYC04958.1 hypothetical protein [Rhodothermaceae bacterium]MYI18016.1 hypothetical protein [Rhodothermaceae bacterium]
MFRLVAFLATASLFFLFVPATIAQFPFPSNDALTVNSDSPQELMRRAMMNHAGQTGILALEGALDPNEYLVGPGDVFNVMIGSVIPTELPVTVSVSGALSLPEVGLLQASGRSLAEVEQEALALLESRFSNAPVSISLVQARSFYVHVTGTVARTGRYLMLPVSRVSDVIQQALSSGVITTRQTIEDVEVNVAMPERALRPQINDIYQPALRNIRIQRIDGTEELVDFIRYQTTGSTDHNPFLRDGDRLNVPAYHIVREGIRVSGDVAWPGLYDWRPDDTVLSLLDLAMGGRPLDETTQFRVMRWGNEQYRTILDHNYNSLQEDSISTQSLMPGDHITVYERKTAIASIEGWVTYPGEYRIEGGVTTLNQLVELAGGLREGANPNAAILERTSVDKLIQVPEVPLPTVQAQPLSGNLAVQSFTEGFQKSFSGEIGNQVAADIAGALAGSSDDIVLYDGDRLVFPRDEGTIFVSGHVPQPGYVTFVPGRTAQYYVDRAGGLGPGAEDIYIYDGSSGTVRKGLNEPIRSGDTIFVDWLEQLTLSTRQIRLQRIQVFVTSLSAATGVTATIIALLR